MSGKVWLLRQSYPENFPHKKKRSNKPYFVGFTEERIRSSVIKISSRRKVNIIIVTLTKVPVRESLNFSLPPSTLNTTKYEATNFLLTVKKSTYHFISSLTVWNLTLRGTLHHPLLSYDQFSHPLRRRGTLR